MSLPPPQNPNSVPNRTPFDDDLLNDPNAPRHTQPLTSQTPPVTPSSATSSTQTSLPSGPSTVSGAPALPRQVTINDTPTKATTTLDWRRLPMSVVVGLAMTGGALVVILLSTAVGHLIPHNVKQNTDPNLSLPHPTPSAPRVVMVPPSSTPDPANDLPTPETPPTPQPPQVQATPDTSAPDNTSTDEATPDTSSTSDATPDDSSPDSTSPDTIAPAATPTPNTSPSPNATPDTNIVNGVYHSRRHRYSIQPPDNFRVIQRGRRTAWHGPDETKLLIESGGAGGASPREGWEKLDRALQRKYGARYQNRGIRDTVINGRPAAVWEFDLDTKTGRVHKMDVAVHEGNRGFAVLATAPVDKFESWRPRFDSAIQSLQIEAETQNEASATSSPTPDGY